MIKKEIHELMQLLVLPWKYIELWGRAFWRQYISTWRDNYKKLTGSDPLICVRCRIVMEFWFVRYGPDKRVLKHFGLEKSDRIPIKQFALKSV